MRSWLTHLYECVLTVNMNMKGGQRSVPPTSEIAVFLVDLGNAGWGGRC